LPPRNSLLLERGSLFALANSLFLVAGNSSLTQRSGSKTSAHPPPGGPDFREIPCIFPAYQGIGRGDEFALDCPHRHLVCGRGDCRRASRVRPRMARDSAGLGRWALAHPNRRLRPRAWKAPQSVFASVAELSGLGSLVIRFGEGGDRLTGNTTIAVRPPEAVDEY